MNLRNSESNIPLYGQEGKWKAKSNIVGGKQLDRVPISATQAQRLVNDAYCERKWGSPQNLANMVYAIIMGVHKDPYAKPVPKRTKKADKLFGDDFMGDEETPMSSAITTQSDIIRGVGLASRNALSAVLSLSNQYSEVLSSALLSLSSEYERRLLQKGDPRGAIYLLDGLGWNCCVDSLAIVPETAALKQHNLDLSKLSSEELVLFEKLTKKALEEPVQEAQQVAE